MKFRMLDANGQRINNDLAHGLRTFLFARRLRRTPGGSALAGSGLEPRRTRKGSNKAGMGRQGPWPATWSGSAVRQDRRSRSGCGGCCRPAGGAGVLEVVTRPDDAAMKPAGKHRRYQFVSCIAVGDTEKEGPAGQRGSLFKGPDAAGRPAGFIPPGGGWRGGSASASLRAGGPCGAGPVRWRAMPRHLQLSRRTAPLLLASGLQSRSLRRA